MPDKTTAGEPGQGLLTMFKAIRRRLSNRETWTWLLVALGVYFRLAEYADNRKLYMDERSLLRNLVERPVFDFTTPLVEDQLAAPGFLVVERVLVRLPCDSVWAARLLPLVCAIASMFLMRAVCRRFLSPGAVPIALGLFALDDWLIYYSAEIKQYSSDTILTLWALLLAPDSQAMSRWRRLILVSFGVAAVWFSHPVALVLAAVGTYLTGESALRKDWKNVRDDVAMCLLWATSFAVCYFVSHRILSKDRFVWDWWNFAFLPIPPRSLADLERTFWQVLNIFNSPAWVLTPLGVLASAFLALGLYLVGALSLGRRWRGGVYLLIAPLLFTLVASALRQYPFHGRLLLFLVPCIHPLVGQGAAVLARPGRVILPVALALFLLIQPAGQALWNRLVVHRFHGGHDSHGDLFPDLLDYLEKREINNPTAPPLPEHHR